ncbi:hypothetical protein SBV1_340010 [Verrucomicrobia bacterium]|nr:hypothetical protein SBV1_340010 [Verrucomicrobiota bacterium]
MEVAVKYDELADAYGRGIQSLPLIDSAPSYPGTNAGNFDEVMGPGWLQYVTNVTSGCVTSAVPWITNVTARHVSVGTNRTTSLRFSVVGGVDGTTLYDVFGASQLVGSQLSDAQIVWLGQVQNCGTYLLSNLTDSAVFLVLGTPQDSSGSGLTDAYKLLVAKMNPNTFDTYGFGIADWWLWEYFGTNAANIDPYALCPSGDGWTILQAYQNGWNPKAFYTPQPPQNVVATVDATLTNVTITWSSGGGPVANYSIEGSSLANPVQVSASTFRFTTSVGYPLFGTEFPQPYYQIRANFEDGTSAVSPAVSVFKPSLFPNANLVRGPGGHCYLTAGPLDPSISALYLAWATNPGPTGWTGVYLPVTNFVNGLLALPDSLVQQIWQETADGCSWIQAISTSGAFSDVRFCYASWPVGFADASALLKQNLKFLLRSPTLTTPFSYTTDVEDLSYAFYPSDVSAPAGPYSREATSTNYEYYGSHTFSSNINCAFLEESRPVAENFLWRNLVFDTNEYNAYGPTNGLDQSFSDPYLRVVDTVYDPIEYEYRDTFGVTGFWGWVMNDLYEPGAVLPYALTNASSSAFFAQPLDAFLGTQVEEAGLRSNAMGQVYLPGAVSNVFGLAIDSVLFGADSLGDEVVWLAGGPAQSPGEGGWQYSVTAVPGLHTVDYYFVSQTAFLQLPGAVRPPMPGSPDFTVTNTSPLLIAAFGQPYTVMAWAKQQITNGCPGKYAYLEQYFSGANMTGTNGSPTTNSAGLLSPYGEFFPTQPGLVGVGTMPDIETGQTATGVVNVIKLQLDVNHDGVMDLSFGGPDNTSQGRPFTFWVNNDCDTMTYVGDPGEDVEVSSTNQYDYNLRYVPSMRDLEDWARLWICGMPALEANQGYSVTLSMTAQSGNPAINLMDTVETNGGTLYLTDSNTAYAQVFNGGHRLKYPTISPTTPLTLPANPFTNAGNKYFLFEGAGIGQGQLTMTMSQNGTNVLAQTSLWLDLNDVKDFYEQAYATNVTSGKPPSSLVSNFGVIQTATSPAPDETKQIVVFIHGINNTGADYDTTTRTIFKRLYWAGYHGRFASFRWPCAYLPPTTANPFKYNLGEFYAFKSATALKNYLSYLRNNRPDLAGYAIDLYAHSQGNVVTSEAILQGAPFDNYILTQGAFPAHCYDTNAPFLQQLLDAETNSVNAVQTPFYPVDGGYHGYCLSIHGNLIDFYNTNDFALATGTTLGLQTNWKEDQRTQKPEAFLGGPSYIYDVPTHVTTGYYTLGNSYTVTDLQEIKALVARSRSAAVGAQGGLHGAISGSIDLFSNYGFGNTRDEHSAQFARPIQTCLPYYRQMLTSFQIVTP